MTWVKVRKVSITPPPFICSACYSHSELGPWWGVGVVTHLTTPSLLPGKQVPHAFSTHNTPLPFVHACTWRCQGGHFGLMLLSLGLYFSLDISTMISSLCALERDHTGARAFVAPLLLLQRGIPGHSGELSWSSWRVM